MRVHAAGEASQSGEGREEEERNRRGLLVPGFVARGSDPSRPVREHPRVEGMLTMNEGPRRLLPDVQIKRKRGNEAALVQGVGEEPTGQSTADPRQALVTAISYNYWT